MIRKEEFNDPTSGTVIDVSKDVDMERLCTALIKKDTHSGDRTAFDFAAGTQCIGRGDEKRSSTFSCLGIRKLPKEVLGPTRGHIMIILLNDRKVESEETGRQFLSIARHRILALDGQGAISRYLFRRFVMENEPKVGFRCGRMYWYNRVLFKKAPKGGYEEQLSYAASYEAVRGALISVGVTGGHVTHFMRVFGASTIEAKAQGHMSPDQAKRLGGWNQNSHDLCYNNDVPVSAAMVQAGFPATDFARHYCVSRAPDSTEIIPEEFLDQISFYVEAKEYLLFASQNPGALLADNLSICGSSINFAHFLVECAKILCEDAHELKTTFPHLSIHRYAPFNTAAFVQWSSERAARHRSSTAAVEKLNEASALLASPIRNSLRVVQDEVHEGFKGILAQLTKVEGRGDILCDLMSPRQAGLDNHFSISMPESALQSRIGIPNGMFLILMSQIFFPY
jgi:hypothetical protein